MHLTSLITTLLTTTLLHVSLTDAETYKRICNLGCQQIYSCNTDGPTTNWWTGDCASAGNHCRGPTDCDMPGADAVCVPGRADVSFISR